jgi:hypothetical protein
MPGVFADDLPELCVLQDRFNLFHSLKAIPVNTGIGRVQPGKSLQLGPYKGKEPVQKIPVDLFDISLRPVFLAWKQFIMEGVESAIAHHPGRLAECFFIIPGAQ